MLIRNIRPNDSEKFVKLVKAVENESNFMLFEPGERMMEPGQQKRRIEAMEKEGNSTIILAEDNNDLIGYLIAIGGSARRKRHSAYLVIGILKEYRGLGIGTKLFKNLEEWAHEHHIHRLELAVIANNEAGLGLYKKIGFVSEGIKKHSLLINDNYVDEYYMAKLL
ncbi:GNAT family N-acetyltransferase [Cytobacillus solani]|uniref:GNAT family N-acetyltransferase n=1 Tax=Cytobacillus solani TaxID=1637975 RepID=UPI00114D7FF9|nr:GNAT family N-acetyltransferase [Cytobacillus solani]